MNKFFCYFNVEESFICKISPVPEDSSDNIIVFEISEEDAISFLSGKKSPHDWTVTRENSKWTLIKRAAFAQKSRSERSKIVKLNLASFLMDADVHVIVNNAYIDVYIKNESIASSTDSMITMYITPKDDSSYILGTININLIDLRKKIQYTDGIKTQHVRQRITRNNNTSISLFMEYLFPIMTMEYKNNDS